MAAPLLHLGLQPPERLAFALDVDNFDNALRLVNRLRPWDTGILMKIGLEMIMRYGITGLECLVPKGRVLLPYILDAKFGGDISATMMRCLKPAIESAYLKPRFVTVHDCVGRTREALDKLGADTKILRVTVLTDTPPEHFGGQEGVTAEVLRITEQALKEGADGVVCSPREAAAVRSAFPEAIILGPGIRKSTDLVMGDDQARTMTPAEAIKAGVSILVVGRPIRDAADPLVATRLILEEMVAAV